MTRRFPKSKAEKLNSMQLAIENTLDSQEIIELVAAFGYSAEVLDEGRTLYQNAIDAVNAKEAAHGDQKQATDDMLKARGVAETAYQGLAKVARAVFIDDKASLTALELWGIMPRATAAFFKRAYTLFDNALSVEGSKAALASYGYDEARVQSEREKIVVYDEANQAQEAAKGAAQQATQDQNKAMALMYDWYARYRKVAKVALQDKPQLLEKLGIPARTTLTRAQREARKRRKVADPI
jgi:hypothetical protein